MAGDFRQPVSYGLRCSVFEVASGRSSVTYQGQLTLSTGPHHVVADAEMVVVHAAMTAEGETGPINIPDDFVVRMNAVTDADERRS